MARVGFREWLAIAPVIASGRLSRYGNGDGGPLARFERDFSAAFGVRHTLTTCNGTSALIAALVAAGVGPFDEVLVPAYTWIATAGAVVAVGAVPVLVDIDETLTMDPADIQRKITPRTRAIIPVHMANLVCDMDSIMQIARTLGLIVIEDACQAVGASYKGQRVGTIGDIGAFSFNQFKNISIGEGGAVVTNDDALFARARTYHDIGSVFRGHLDNANEPPFCGVNFKANQIQGAMLNVQMKKLDPMLRRMRRRRDAIADMLSAGGLRIGPHHDPANAIGLHVIFNSEAEAEAFASAGLRGVYRIYDSSRHVYTFWQPILQQRAAHPQMDPFAWSAQPMDYSPNACARSLEILKRTCRIGLGENYVFPLAPLLARQMVRRHSASLQLPAAAKYGT